MAEQQRVNTWAKFTAMVNFLRKKAVNSFSGSLVTASVVASGEALVAAFFMGASASIPIMLAIAIPAFIVNFILFRSDTLNFFKSIGNNELFKDNTKQPFTGWKKYFLGVAMGLALFSGLLCGVLQLNSILITLGGLFWGLSAAAAISFPPVGLVIGALLVAAFSAVANAALLYASIEKFIRNEEYNYYKWTFQAILGKKINPLTGTLTKKPMALKWRLYHSLFLVLGVIPGIGVFMVSRGPYVASTYNTLNSLFKIPALISKVLTMSFGNIGHILNGFFYARNMLNFSKLIEWSLKKAMQIKLCFNYTNLFHKENVNKLSVSKAIGNLIVLPISVLGFSVILYCSYVNAVSQGRGAMLEPESLGWLKLLGMSDRLAQLIAYGLQFAGSGFSAATAGYDEVKEFIGNSEAIGNKVRDVGRGVRSVVGCAREAFVAKQYSDAAVQVDSLDFEPTDLVIAAPSIK